MIHKVLFIFLLASTSLITNAQELSQKISSIQNKLEELELEKQELLKEKEALQLNKIIEDMDKMGYPSSDYIKHSALVLSYNEEHEQANWVMHMILPDVTQGTVFRSNDFRPDPLILSGSAIQEDYFLTDTMTNGEVKYDGFGYDRGHLAPSADYRWSSKALSETYFYSNMSPQLPGFNREIWAGLEDHLRKYVADKNVPLYILTAPILRSNLAKIERSKNQLSIPETFIKIALDPINKCGIAFVLDNSEDKIVLEGRAVTIDEAEELLGFDVFPLFNQFEDNYELVDWFDNLNNGDVEPLAQEDLGRGQFNTIVGGKRIGKESTVCGQVVSTKISRAGHLWLNIDKKFPNQIFSIFIRKENLTNFPYNPQVYYEQKIMCFEGKVEDLNGTPTITVRKESQVEILD